jgi:hypothetical protein
MDEPIQVPVVPARPVWRRWLLPAIVVFVLVCCGCAALTALFAFGDNVVQAIDRPAQSEPEVANPNDSPRDEGDGNGPSTDTGIQLFVDGTKVAASSSGVCALYYQTNVGVTADLKLIVPQGYSWALDADSIMQYGPVNALDDVLFFGDEPGTYNITDVSSGGLCVAQAGAAPDLAGPAILNRATAAKLYQWPRPTFYMTPDGVLEKVTVDPFGE